MSALEADGPTATTRVAEHLVLLRPRIADQTRGRGGPERPLDVLDLVGAMAMLLGRDANIDGQRSRAGRDPDLEPSALLDPSEPSTEDPGYLPLRLVAKVLTRVGVAALHAGNDAYRSRAPQVGRSRAARRSPQVGHARSTAGNSRGPARSPEDGDRRPGGSKARRNGEPVDPHRPLGGSGSHPASWTWRRRRGAHAPHHRQVPRVREEPARSTQVRWACAGYEARADVGSCGSGSPLRASPAANRLRPADAVPCAPQEAHSITRETTFIPPSPLSPTITDWPSALA